MMLVSKRKLIVMFAAALLAPSSVLAGRRGHGPRAGFLSCYSPLLAGPEEDAPTIFTPMTFSNQDGSLVCARYQFTCSQDDTACTDYEMEAKVDKWNYIMTTKESCATLHISGARNVLCCSTNNCNKPDPKLDKAAAKSKSTAVSCLSPAPSMPGTPTTLIPTVTGQRGTVCARYQGRCTHGDTLCSAAEIKAGAWKWAYVPVTKDTCDAMRAAPHVYRVLFCCSTDNCNKPDAKLDKATKVFIP